MEDIIEAAKFLLTGATLRELLARPDDRGRSALPAPHQPLGSVVKQEYTLQTQRVMPRSPGCAFCIDLSHYIRDCPHVDAYLKAGKITRGASGRLCMLDGRPILRLAGCSCMKASIDRLETSLYFVRANTFNRDPPPHMTAGILSIACPEGEVELKIEPSAFLSVVDDPDQSMSPYLTDPDSQPYFAQAWVRYQADRSARDRPCGKQVWFNGVEFPACPLGLGNLCAAMVADEIVSPEVLLCL
ncbi:hypothetical protein PAXRUDRAFT_172526 [Paxillus rubicundulus Ve08.2h10]|uniref:Uncharacterized protein n=1 Tax=Paxillus rubicundulus Ve08.2h10 TaxID=930991 RepID=A0A0D0DDQ0_9AGAM|nr:hypothetical protein PAXRUDRAFT_172526 [Paxillus rubicundulus Ve08.2h10]